MKKFTFSILFILTVFQSNLHANTSMLISGKSAMELYLDLNEIAYKESTWLSVKQSRGQRIRCEKGINYKSFFVYRCIIKVNSENDLNL